MAKIGRSGTELKFACLSNMRQIIIGLQMYATDHRNELPPSMTTRTFPGDSSTSYRPWAGLLVAREYGGYIRNPDVFICPSRATLGNMPQKRADLEAAANQPSTGNQWVDVWVLPPSNDQVSQYPKIYLRNSANKIRATINLTTNDGRINHEPGTSFLTDDWNRITIYVDQDDNKWDVYINGVLALGDQALAYPNTDIFHYQIAWTGKGDAGKEDDAYYFDDFQITTTNPIPEPATMGMALGFGGAMLMRRKRK